MSPKSPTFIGELITAAIGAIVRGELQGVARDASEEAMDVAVRRIRKRFPRPTLFLAREVLNRAIGDEPLEPGKPDDEGVIDVECEVVNER